MLVKKAYELVGNTPLLELTNIEKELDLKSHIFAKIELFNPAGSIKDDEAFEFARLVGKKEGVLVEISSGAALAAAIKIAQKEDNKNIVVIFPDSGDRYLSTKLFE